MTDTDQATKRPWIITEDNDTGSNDNYYIECLIIGPVQTIPKRRITKEDRANARLIVNACNNYDEVVTLLKECHFILDMPAWKDLRKRIIQALSKAGDL